MQEDYLRDRQQGAGSSWDITILRPQIIFGEAFGSNMNALPALGVYAAVLRDQGRALDYPGGGTSTSEAVDGDLLAEALLWAATSEAAANETFNISNRDVFSIANLWPSIADAFGMEVGEPRPPSLVSTIKVRQAGFTTCVDTEDMFRRLVASFQQ